MSNILETLSSPIYNGEHVYIDASGPVQVLRYLDSGKIVEKAKLRKNIRKELSSVQRVARTSFTHVFTDPRKAAQGVKLSVWRQSVGGSVSLYSSRKSSGRKAENPYRKGSGKTGRIVRRNISSRTQQINEYYGKDRSFILRWIASGTAIRTAGRRDRAMAEANRGRIDSDNFFDTAIDRMPSAQQNVNNVILNYIKSVKS